MTALRKSRRPLAALSWCLAIAGFAAFFIIPRGGVAFGAALIVVALLIDRKTFLCGACGNKIEKTSTLCPSCRADISDRITPARSPGRSR